MTTTTKLLGGLLAVGAIAGTGLAAASVVKSGASPHDGVPLEIAKVKAVESAHPSAAASSLASRFKALREPSSVKMPAALSGILAEEGSRMREAFGPDFAQVRLLSSPGLSPAVWLVPGDDSLCLYVIYSSDDGGSTCQTSSDVLVGRLELVRHSPAVTSIVGVVPDGVDTVTAAASDGTPTTVPVVYNMYSVGAADSSDTTITFNAPG